MDDILLCGYVKFELVQMIIDSCVNLIEVNFSNTKLDQESINYIVNNLTPKVETLSLGDISLHDNHIEALVQRCNKLKFLDLSACRITNMSLNHIIMHLNNTLEDLNLDSTYVDFDSLLHLRSMTKLKVIHFYEEAIEKKKHLFPSQTICTELMCSKIKGPNPRERIWEIEAKQLQVFQGRWSPIEEWFEL